MSGRRWWAVAALALVVASLSTACDQLATDPEEGVPEEELEFLRFPDNLLPLVTKDTSFWAVRGRDSELIMRYAPEEGEDQGEEFLSFRVRDETLLERPDGTLFAAGDSILISVSVDEGGRFLFDFQPSGLKFNPDEPAELEVEYLRLEGDLDGDGDVDEDDDDFEQNLRLWRQEAPGERWFPIGTIHLEDTDELRGEIEGFTGFAVAI